MARDPVCGMEIDERGFTFRTEYKGKVYHFCRPTCKELFLTDPKRYIASLEEKGGDTADSEQSRRTCPNKGGDKPWLRTQSAA
jgi:YHS domain-containing protein